VEAVDGAEPLADSSAPVLSAHSGRERFGPLVSGTNSLPTTPTEAGPPEAFTHRLGASILESANGGKVLRMRMHPPELGVLQIEVASVEGVVTARLDVESARAHRAILDNLPQLHEMLGRTHTQIDRIELNVLENQAGPEGQARQFGQSSKDHHAQGQPLPAEALIPNEDADSRAERDSLGKSRQREERRSRSLPLSGIDIQV
jgi:flagellar hook-length control protein FliK